MHVLLLRKFMHVLEVYLRKKGHLLLIAASMKLLPNGSGSFGHNSSLGKFLDLVAEKHQQPSGKTSL